jgi:hypothetical protein
MRAGKFALAFLILGFAVFSKAADPALEYKAYATADGRFKILFPGPVKTETTDVKAASGTLKLTLDSVEVADGILFVVSYIDAPDEVAKQPAGPRLDKVRDGNKGADGKILTEKSIELGLEKLPGRDLLIEKPNLFIRNRAVIAGNRLYQVMVQGSKEFVTSKEVDRFFDAFEVTK